MKVAHTVVWAFFVACIAGIPVASAMRRFWLANVLTGFVALEGVVLACNGGRCPLTDLAGRYTEDRAANFDIYLPLWLARHNKVLFGSLFVVDVAFLVWQFTR